MPSISDKAAKDAVKLFTAMYNELDFLRSEDMRVKTAERLTTAIIFALSKGEVGEQWLTYGER